MSNVPRYTISSRSSTPKRSRTAGARARRARGCRAPSRRPSLTMKLAWRSEIRAPPIAASLQPRAVDERPGRSRHAVRHGLSQPRDSERCSPRSATPAAASPSDSAATRARARAATTGSPAPTPKIAAHTTISPVRFSRLVSYANSISSRAREHRRAGATHELDGAHEIADVLPAPVRVAIDGAAHRAGRARPGFEARQPAADRPSDEAVDRDTRPGPNHVAGRLRRWMSDADGARPRPERPHRPRARSNHRRGR